MRGKRARAWKSACETTSIRSRTASLLLDPIALGNPILTKVVRQVEGLHILKAHADQEPISRSHVWAPAPGTAAAIENNKLPARKRGDTVPQQFDTFRLHGWACEF